jgi:hypothetical protein
MVLTCSGARLASELHFYLSIRMEISRDSGFASGKNRSDALLGTETFQTPGTVFFTVWVGQITVIIVSTVFGEGKT